jgi:hypothetical protein
MKNRIFGVMVALSSILCIAAIALWIQSYEFPLKYWPISPDSGLMSDWGSFRLLIAPTQPPPKSHAIAIDADEYHAPYWIIVSVFALPPTLWLFRLRRHRLLMKRGICRTCGYDLRATPDRCPECGTIPLKKK